MRAGNLNPEFGLTLPGPSVNDRSRRGRSRFYVL